MTTPDSDLHLTGGPGKVTSTIRPNPQLHVPGGAGGVTSTIRPAPTIPGEPPQLTMGPGPQTEFRVGGAVGGAPSTNVDGITSIAQFKSVAGAALNQGAAESWTTLADAFDASINGLTEFQQDFSSAVQGVKPSFQGWAGDQFQDFANNQILRRSQGVTTALSGYPAALRSIGKSIT